MIKSHINVRDCQEISEENLERKLLLVRFTFWATPIFSGNEHFRRIITDSPDLLK